VLPIGRIPGGLDACRRPAVSVEPVLRFLVSGRAMALHLLMALCAVTCLLLAQWQWDRAQARFADPTAIPAVPLAELSRPSPDIVGSSLGRLAIAEGRFDPDRSFVVTGRPPDDAAAPGAEPPVWDLAVLEVEDGTLLPVVLGARDASAPAPEPPSGPVVVEGRIQPSEDLTVRRPGADADPDAGRLEGIATSELVGLVGGPLHPGYLALTEPVIADGPRLLTGDEVILPEQGLKLQNVLYTVQWVVFGGFVVFVYRRFLMDAWRDHQARVVTAPQDEETV
jgi:cytochrome oxidase assembly protein ShyY1